ncbi:recombinase family protein [Photobacterium damselae subsp. damselae]|uniref:recombinase family protein n=1 Tax=Photobacterium damselae TaxID=38293 RepID=UPI0010FD7A9F|nr:recombinase family protein [Photobacterium damselae]TLS83008.1 recombinase family protein [Photobacterium damselae subsp. damselae]TLS90514.1 recombinase family protein [Photobacterium damselae subsp. damselae]
MSKVGYARVSTTEQSLDLQIQQLEDSGCIKIFSDTASGSNTKRAGFIALMDYIRNGDILIITRIDRIARSVLDLQQLVQQLKEHEIILEVLEQPISTNSASGKAFLDMLAVFAEFELNIRKERQLEGIAAAKIAGKYRGRKPLSNKVKTQVSKLYAEHNSITAIASNLKISRNSVYKILKKIK